MRNYEPLTEEEIAKYKAMLKEPSEESPYYEPFEINKKDVNKYVEDDLSPDEEWRQIERIFDECGVRLFVSNYGRIKRNGKIESPTPIWDDSGKQLFIQRYSVYISPSNTELLHRLVLEAFDPIEEREKYQVHHLDNNAHNNSTENLIWVTGSDHDKIAKKFESKIKEIHNKIREERK